MAGLKRFEVRTWSTDYRGWLWIHASTGTPSTLKKRRKELMYQQALRRAGIVDESAWVRGAILGAVRLRRIIGPKDPRPQMSEMARYLGGGKQESFCYLWEMATPVPFDEPIPCDGWLKLWRLVPPTFESELEAKLRRWLRRNGKSSDLEPRMVGEGHLVKHHRWSQR